MSAEIETIIILATVAFGLVKGASLHSFMLTEIHVILCIFEFSLAKHGIKMLRRRNIIDTLEFHAKRTKTCLISDRRREKD